MYPNVSIAKWMVGVVLFFAAVLMCTSIVSYEASPADPNAATSEVRTPTATPEEEGDFLPFFLLMGEANAFAEMLQQHHSDFAITRDEERYQCAEVTDALVNQQRFADEVEQRIAENRPVVHNSIMVAYDLEQLRIWSAQSPKFIADLEAHRDECARVGLLP